MGRLIGCQMSTVNLPDGRAINFPDGMSQEDISAAVLSIPKAAPALTPREQIPEGDISWSDVGTGAVKNLWPSAKGAAGDFVQPFIHPVDTAEAIGALGRGVIQKISPKDMGWAEDEKNANAVGEFFVKRYGGAENIKKTMASDPVGFLSDAAGVLSMGGLAAMKAPGTVGIIAKATGEVGKAIDPLSNALKAAGTVVNPIVREVIGQTTGAGGKAIGTAYEAGRTGGRVADAFQDNLRRVEPIENVVTEAKGALARMARERSQEYRAGMGGVNADLTVLNFKPIDKAVRDAAEVGIFKGVSGNSTAMVLDESTRPVWDKISQKIDDWRMADPAEFHTVEGFDALKKAIGDIRDSTEFRTPARKIADDVYNAVRQEIVSQAPDYAKVMKDYETASNLIQDIEKTLSLNPKASVDTAVRKLQSIMRNNANTNYGRREDLAALLASKGAPDMFPKLAGQALSSYTPRGLQGVGATLTGGAGVGSVLTGGATLAGALQAAPLMAAFSPRLMGEGAYYLGKAARLGDALSVPVQASAYQTGREKNRLSDEQAKRLAEILSQQRAQ